MAQITLVIHLGFGLSQERRMHDLIIIIIIIIVSVIIFCSIND